MTVLGTLPLYNRKRPVSDKPCYPDRVWEALVGGGLSIVTGLASGSNSSNLEFGVSVKLEALFTAGRICAEGNAGGCLRSAASRDGG